MAVGQQSKSDCVCGGRLPGTGGAGAPGPQWETVVGAPAPTESYWRAGARPRLAGPRTAHPPARWQLMSEQGTGSRGRPGQSLMVPGSAPLPGHVRGRPSPVVPVRACTAGNRRGASRPLLSACAPRAHPTGNLEPRGPHS